MQLVPDDWPDVPYWLRRFFETEIQKAWLRVEEYEDAGIHVVRAELPGIDPEKDVEITVVNGVLTIKASREEKSETRRKERYRSEFRYGSFTRSVTLPAGATEDDVTASYSDGVLEVRVPIGKVSEPQRKKVEVKRG
jgi:HSP20 family protein